MMERSEETLSTRDLAQPSEPATGRGAVDSTGGGPEGGPVYDQERAGQGEPAASIATEEQSGIGSRVEEANRSEAVEPTAGAAGPPAAGMAAAGAAGTGTADSASNSAPLLSAEASSSFQLRWKEVQTRFVDEPRAAVEEADGLVANLMQQLAEGFAQERERLEAQWDRGEDISTEDLRVALQRYRSFFQRLLSA